MMENANEVNNNNKRTFSSLWRCTMITQQHSEIPYQRFAFLSGSAYM